MRRRTAVRVWRGRAIRRHGAVRVVRLWLLRRPPAWWIVLVPRWPLLVVVPRRCVMTLLVHWLRWIPGVLLAGWSHRLLHVSHRDAHCRHALCPWHRLHHVLLRMGRVAHLGRACYVHRHLPVRLLGHGLLLHLHVLWVHSLLRIVDILPSSGRHAGHLHAVSALAHVNINMRTRDHPNGLHAHNGLVHHVRIDLLGGVLHAVRTSGVHGLLDVALGRLHKPARRQCTMFTRIEWLRLQRAIGPGKTHLCPIC